MQSKLGISTYQRPASNPKSIIDVLQCEQPLNRKEEIYEKIINLFNGERVSKGSYIAVKTPLREKRRQILIDIQSKVETEIEKLLKEGHIEN